MELRQKIKDDSIVALKNKDSETASVLRMALSALNTKEKEKRYVIAKENPEMTEEELAKQSALQESDVVDVIASEVKKRRDAIALYDQGGRPELAEVEKKEIALLQVYLPAQLSSEEIRALVQEAVTSLGASGIKDMGKVMAELSPKIKGKADGQEVSKIVKELLG